MEGRLAASTGPGTVGISSAPRTILDGFHERYPNGLLHYTSQTWTVDGQLSYDFTFVAPVENPAGGRGIRKMPRMWTRGKDGKAAESAPAQTATEALPLWKRALNGTHDHASAATISLVRILRRASGFERATRPIILASFMMPPDASFTCS